MLPIESQTYHVCENDCMLFTKDTVDCEWCGESRHKISNPLRPNATMRYLPLSELLGSMLASPSYRAMFRSTFEEIRTTGSLTDIFDGLAFEKQEHLFGHEFSVGLDLFCDGILLVREANQSQCS